jgi:hypothetical protein
MAGRAANCCPLREYVPLESIETLVVY